MTGKNKFNSNRFSKSTNVNSKVRKKNNDKADRFYK